MSEVQTPESAAGLPPETAPAPTPDRGTSPGELLRRARAARNLSVADLVAQTRLSRATLEALERNDFATLSKPVYVRGYFRKCAKVLELPEDELIRAYAAWSGTPLEPEPQPVRLQEPAGEEYDTADGGWPVKYVLLTAVAAGILLWWLLGSRGGETPAPAAPEAGGVTTLPLAPPAFETPAQPPVPAETLQPANDDAAAPAAVEPAVPATSPPSATETTATLPVTPRLLQISVERASWMEVKDGSGKRLVWGLLEAGTRREVSGQLPYELIVGNAAGVSLSLGGRAVDLKPYTKSSGAATLTLERAP